MDKKSQKSSGEKITFNLPTSEMEAAQQEYDLALKNHAITATAVTTAEASYEQACAHLKQVSGEYRELRSKLIQENEEYSNLYFELLRPVVAGHALINIKQERMKFLDKEVAAQKIKAAALEKITNYQYLEEYRAMCVAALTEVPFERNLGRTELTNIGINAAREAARQSQASTNLLSEVAMEIIDTFIAKFLYDEANDQHYSSRSLTQILLEKSLTEEYLAYEIQSVNAKSDLRDEKNNTVALTRIAYDEKYDQLVVARAAVSAADTTMKNAKEALEDAEIALNFFAANAADGDLCGDLQDEILDKESALPPISIAGSRMENLEDAEIEAIITTTTTTTTTITTTTTTTTRADEAIPEEINDDLYWNLQNEIHAQEIARPALSISGSSMEPPMGEAIDAPTTISADTVISENMETIIEISGSKSHDFLEQLP